MERRDLLRSAALGATLALLPPFLRRAFGAAGDVCEVEGARTAHEALERARQRGKPLLVFVVPDGEDARGRRGRLFGELVDLGSERSLAMLALADVVCAPIAAMRCLVPDATVAAVPDDAVMLLVEHQASAATARPIPMTLPPEPQLPELGLHSEKAEAAFWRGVYRSDVALLTAPLRHALAGPALGRLARVNARALRPEDRRRVLAFVADSDAALPIDVADAAAPFLLASAIVTHEGDARRRALARLAAVGRWRLQEHQPTGGRWVRLEGCGGDYPVRADGDEVGEMACGMASIPFLSARFLNFHTAVR